MLTTNQAGYLKQKIKEDRIRVKNKTIDEAIEVVKKWRYIFDFKTHHAILKLIIDDLYSKKEKTMNEYKKKCCCEPSRDYEDCRYYSVEFDMGANIARCTLNPPDGMEAFSYCPCIDNNGKCKQYISKKDPNGDFIAGQQRTVDQVLEIIDDVLWKCQMV